MLITDSFADINECVLGLDNCDHNATCHDSDGSYDCYCNSGYEGDGFSCESELMRDLNLSIQDAAG